MLTFESESARIYKCRRDEAKLLRAAKTKRSLKTKQQGTANDSSMSKDNLSNQIFFIRFMESLILAQDERWRRA